MTVGSGAEVLFSALRLLRDHWPAGGWSWDPRLSCLASSFSIELVPAARRTLRSALRCRWTDETLATAPPAVVDLAEATGGVRAGQEIFCTEEFGGSLAFALWWPWEDGHTVSVRVGLAGGRVEDEEARLRELFGASA